MEPGFANYDPPTPYRAAVQTADSHMDDNQVQLWRNANKLQAVVCRSSAVTSSTFMTLC